MAFLMSLAGLLALVISSSIYMVNGFLLKKLEKLKEFLIQELSSKGTIYE